jgi:hypothetical protein
MRTFNRFAIAFAHGLFFLCSASAFGGDGLMITINNDSTDNLIVTVYDQNTNPPQKILSAKEIYGSASISVAISPDDLGKGHVSWTATTVDHNMRRCGHNDKPNLNGGDTVRVHADGDCGG